MIIKTSFSNNRQLPILYNDKSELEYLSLKYLIENQKNKSYRTKYISMKSNEFMYKYYYEKTNVSLEYLILRDKFDIISYNLYPFFIWLNSQINSKSNLYIYINSLKKYIEWALLNYSKDFNKYFDKITNIFNLQQEIYVERSNYNYSTITTLELKEILDFLNLKNPLKKNNQIRNLLIFQLLYETGIRKGELLKLKIEDIIRDNQFYIKIVNRKNDVEDSRKDLPRLKNNLSERIVGISNNTYLLFEKYIKYKRIKNKNHSYLFTSILGKPISKSMIGKIFKVFEDNLEIKCTPHSLRHFFAERMLSYLIENKKMDMERAKDELRSICGWSMNSSMPIKYTRKYIHELSNKHNIERLLNNEK